MLNMLIYETKSNNTILPILAITVILLQTWFISVILLLLNCIRSCEKNAKFPLCRTSNYFDTTFDSQNVKSYQSCTKISQRADI